MNFVRMLCQRSINVLSMPILNKCQLLTHNFSILSSNLPKVNLLPPPISIVPSCGLKVKGFIRRRCADCYFVRREGRLYVMCKTHPRHKQTHPVPKKKHTWILTHACQSKFRPY